jgi:hypothetical protein
MCIIIIAEKIYSFHPNSVGVPTTGISSTRLFHAKKYPTSPYKPCFLICQNMKRIAIAIH